MGNGHLAPDARHDGGNEEPDDATDNGVQYVGRDKGLTVTGDLGTGSEGVGCRCLGLGRLEGREKGRLPYPGCSKGVSETNSISFYIRLSVLWFCSVTATFLKPCLSFLALYLYLIHYPSCGGEHSNARSIKDFDSAYLLSARFSQNQENPQTQYSTDCMITLWSRLTAVVGW